MSEPNTEVTQESKERLEVLDLDRTPRAEKMAREAALLDGASEVQYAERAFRPRHPTTIDDVRARVDALEVQRLALPRPAPLPPAPDAPPRHIPDHLRIPLEAAQPDARLVAVEVAYSTDTGHVVDATFDLDGVKRVEQYVIEGHVARAVDDVDAAVDRLPAPSARAPAATAPPPPAVDAPAPAAAPERSSRFKLPFGKGKKSDPSIEPDAPKEKGSRFGFRRARDKN